MRSIRHWTPRYIKDRIASFYYEKTNAGLPWLTRAANEILGSMLRKSDIGLEFGSGRSTVWFARRVGRLTSVEHNETWASNVREKLKSLNVTNVDYHFLPKNLPDEQGGDTQYVRITDAFVDNSLDFCLVDGVYRDFCALKAIDKIRPGGFLIIDNVNWFLPGQSRSPNSRRPSDGPKGPIWNQVAQRLDPWRGIWTSSGVTDTALFFKPCA